MTSKQVKELLIKPLLNIEHQLPPRTPFSTECSRIFDSFCTQLLNILHIQLKVINRPLLTNHFSSLNDIKKWFILNTDYSFFSGVTVEKLSSLLIEFGNIWLISFCQDESDAVVSKHTSNQIIQILWQLSTYLMTEHHSVIPISRHCHQQSHLLHSHHIIKLFLIQQVLHLNHL